MNAGTLRHRITLNTVSTVQDAYGQIGDALHEQALVPFVTIWGEVKDVSGRELLGSGELHTQITTRIKCRFYPGITESMVATVSMDQVTRSFDILAVTDPEGRRRTLELECRERIG